MLTTENEQADFCREFNISSEKFRNAGLTWNELEQIAEDFTPKRDGHKSTVKLYADALQTYPGVHSLLLQAGGCIDKKVRYYAEDENALIKNLEQIYYHLQYRNTNPQTLELFLVGLESGKKIHIMD